MEAGQGRKGKAQANHANRQGRIGFGRPGLTVSIAQGNQDRGARTKLGTEVVAVARRLVPKCSEAMVTKTAQ